MASVYINALLQACLEFAVHAPSYVLINSRNFVSNGLFEFLNSHDTPLEHAVLQEPPQEKVWYSEVGRPGRPSDVPETRDNSSEHFTNNSHTVSYHVKWHPLLYRSASCQPRQAIAPAQYSNSKCVSRLRATLCNSIKVTLHSTAQETLGIQIVEQQNCLFCMHLDLPDIYSHLIEEWSLTHWRIALGVGMNAVKAAMDWCRHPSDTSWRTAALFWSCADRSEVQIRQRHRCLVVQWFHSLVCHWDAWWSLPPCPEQHLSRFHFNNARIVNICALCWKHMILENDSSSILRLGRCIWGDHGLLGCDSV